MGRILLKNSLLHLQLKCYDNIYPFSVFAAEKDLRRPKIKEGLVDQTIVKKNTVTLKAVIVGDPVPDVTW